MKPGTPAPGGIDPGQNYDANRPVRFNLARGCFEYVDQATVGSDGTRTDSYLKTGFREIGLMVRQRAETEASGFEICGFTIIHPNWILTALHCVAAGEGARTSLYDLKPGKAMLLLMRKDQHNFSPGDCWSRLPTCPYDLVELTGTAYFPAGVTWTNGVPDRDLALLPVEPVPAGRVIADLTWTVGDSGQITVAGYGKSNVPDYKPLKGIQVGWHKVSTIDGTDLLIPQMAGSADSGICMGDSGSAVLVGMENGLVERRHTLVSVVSSITYPGSGAATVGSCMAGVGRAVYIVKFRDWICSTTARQLPACLMP